MFTANDGGVYRTDNARADVARDPQAPCNPNLSKVSFTSLNRNYGATQFYHGAVSPDGKWFIAGAQDNGTILGHIDSGTDGWRMIFGGDGGYVAIDPVDPNNIYVESQGANIVRSTDRGKEFNGARNGLNDQFLFITPFALDASDPRRLWTGGTRVWRTDDRGANWAAASATLEGSVSAIAVASGGSAPSGRNKCRAIFSQRSGADIDGVAVVETPTEGCVDRVDPSSSASSTSLLRIRRHACGRAPSRRDLSPPLISEFR